jgi:hypothetical protein
MKKTPDDLRPEYDFSLGVRGKYSARMAKGSNIVVLDRDVQKVFPDSASVNAALRALAQAVAAAKPVRKSPARKRAASA